MRNCWYIEGRGFLPAIDPVVYLPQYPELEQLANELPYFMDMRRVREELVANLRPLKIDASQSMGALELERLFGLYCYFASSYVHACGENTAARLPAEIAEPLVRLSKRLHRLPILAYASYCLTNWQRIDPTRPIELGNISLLQHFTQEASRDEAWFILVHVDIEARAAQAVSAILELWNLKDGDMLENVPLVIRCLVGIDQSLKAMNKTMRRMPEQCSPEIYYKRVRPYIFGFNNVVYELKEDNQLMTLRGETGAQSSIVPAIQTVLGVKHKNTMLTQHLQDMRKYMPRQHSQFLANLEENGFNLRVYLDQCKAVNIQRFNELKEIYNSCLNGLIEFRSLHLHYAVEYIHKKVDNPNGTGGTPYIPWLSQLVEETKEYLYD